MGSFKKSVFVSSVADSENAVLGGGDEPSGETTTSGNQPPPVRSESPSQPTSDGVIPLARTIKLTPEQEAAASYGVGSRAVVATAGSGKTTTMSARIARLMLDYGVADSDILATTFTRAAASDLKSRIDLMTGRETGVVTGTIHSFCMFLLQSHFRLLGYSRMPTIIDESDVNGLIDQIILQVTGVSDKKLLTAFTTSDVKKWIAEMDVREFSKDERDFDPYFLANPPKGAVAMIGENFKAKLRKYGYLDFDSILVEALRLLRAGGDALAPFLHRHVFIDEAQDLSAVQWFLVEELGKRAVSIDVIGDDDQSIYMWRRALPWRFRDFAERAGSKLFLSANRRCAANIVSLAAEIISAVPPERRIIKDLTAARFEIPGMVRFSVLKNLESFHLIANKIKEEVEGSQGGDGRPRSYSDYALIVRSTTYTFPRAEGALSAAEIPYKILGGNSSFDRPESKFLRAVGALVVSGGDVGEFGGGGGGESAFGGLDGGSGSGGGVLREPYIHWNSVLSEVGVSGGAAEAVITRAESMGGDAAAIRDAVAASRLGDDRKRATLAVVSAVRRLRSDVGGMTFGDFLFDPIISGTAMEIIRRDVGKSIAARRKKEGGLTQEMVDSLIDSGVTERANAFNQLLAPYADYSVHRALASIELNRDMSKDDGTGEPMVTLTTAHSSKGLEWRTVYVLEVNASSWPSPMAGRGMSGVPAKVMAEIMDEERRLLYVSVTRAKDELFLVTAAVNSEKFEINRPSSFLPGWVVETVTPVIAESLKTSSSKGLTLTFKK
jgi:superfamily I DNA/RNA helicase